MIRLNLNPQPEWIELLTGVRVKVAPLTTAVVQAAMSEVVSQTDGTEFSIALTKAIARIAILDWEGVGDADGAHVAPSADYINCLMDLYQASAAFNQLYISRWQVLADEKKGSALLPSGTSAGAPTTAAPAMASAPTAQAS